MIFLLPTLNEERGVQEVVPKIRKHFKDAKILVVDGGSKDRTVSLAKKMGCQTLIQKGKGKGNAILEALEKIKDQEIVAMLDADGTYDPEDVNILLKHLKKKTIVIGNRYEESGKSSFTGLNLFGGKLLNLAASIFFMRRLHDMLSGIRVFKNSEIKSLNLGVQNFEIETQMILKAIKAGFNIVEIPCNYYKRKGESKLNPFIDGMRIMKRIIIERFC